MKKCPYCAEWIQDEAIVCRFCGRPLDPTMVIRVEDELRHHAGIQGDRPAFRRSAKTGNDRPVWKIALSGGLILAGLGTWGKLMQPPSAMLGPFGLSGFFGDLALSLFVGLAFWTLAIAGIVFLHRKIGTAALILIGLALGIIVAIVALASQSATRPENIEARSTSAARSPIGAYNSTAAYATMYAGFTQVAGFRATATACEIAPNCRMVTFTPTP